MPRLNVIAWAAAIAAVAAVCFWPDEGKDRAQRLPDGTIVRLASLSYGKTHRCVTGNIFQRLFGGFLPAPAAGWIGAKIHSVSNATDRLVIFFDLTQQRNARAPGGGYTATPLIVSDDAGNEFIENGENAYRSQSSNELVMAFDIPLAGHLSKKLHLQLKPHDYVKNVYCQADFNALNPGPRSLSHWQGEKLPVTRQRDDFPVTLRAMESSAEALGPSEEGRRSHHWTRFRYQLPPGAPWRVEALKVGDETGEFYGASQQLEPSDSEQDLNALFSSQEPWKVRLELERTADFASNEVWTSPPVAFPKTPRRFAEPLTTDLNGFHVVIDRLNRAALCLTISPSPAARGYDWTFKAGDAKFDSIGGGDYGYQIVYSYTFAQPNERDSVQLTLSIAKTRSMDFIVSPTPLPP
ncbi:MAG TPA: hypothetical protein VHB20_16565 [Verrucomicrobiae bacterium]|jgi:hypothetical protein|nr:hypothetical protein [Verrucomicrobiae bacterium]